MHPKRLTIDDLYRLHLTPGSQRAPFALADVSDRYLAAEAASACDVVTSTWRGYVSRGQAPAAVERIGATPRWDAVEVDRWIVTRPGRGARTDLGWPGGAGDADRQPRHRGLREMAAALALCPPRSGQVETADTWYPGMVVCASRRGGVWCEMAGPDGVYRRVAHRAFTEYSDDDDMILAQIEEGICRAVRAVYREQVAAGAARLREVAAVAQSAAERVRSPLVGGRVMVDSLSPLAYALSSTVTQPDAVKIWDAATILARAETPGARVDSGATMVSAALRDDVDLAQRLDDGRRYVSDLPWETAETWPRIIPAIGDVRSDLTAVEVRAAAAERLAYRARRALAESRRGS